MTKNFGLMLFIIVLMIVSTIFTLRGFHRSHNRVYTSGDKYVDERYGVAFTFPEGWHPFINSRKGENILVVIHKNPWNAEDASANKNKRDFYPYIMLVAYRVDKEERDFSKLINKTLEADFASVSSRVNYFRITREQLVSKIPFELYQVDIDIQYTGEDPVKIRALLSKKEGVLMCLAFLDEARSFDSNVGVLSTVEGSLKISEKFWQSPLDENNKYSPDK